jgi:hypothetical protein
MEKSFNMNSECKYWKMAIEMSVNEIGYFSKGKNKEILFTIVIDKLKGSSISIPIKRVPILYNLWKLNGESGIFQWLENESNYNNTKFARHGKHLEIRRH